MAFVTSVTPLSGSFCGKSWIEFGPRENVARQTAENLRADTFSQTIDMRL
jgi:hypothetical protein